MRLAWRRFLYILRVQFTHPPHPRFPMPPKHRADGLEMVLDSKGRYIFYEKPYALVPDEDWNFPVRGPRG